MDSKAHQVISQAAGPGNYTVSPKTRMAFATDATGRFFPPEGVVRARDMEQVARVMAACTATKTPVVPRGAGSGITGGALPVDGGIVLDLAGLAKIISISPEDQQAVVQPGVITADLSARVHEKGLFYPPDPASSNFSSLGGNVAENAGGLKAVKYGVTRDYVMAVKAVLPDGRIFKTGSRAIKSVVGYDLTRLLVGSEGTLAVLMELTLKLLPLPEAKSTMTAVFADLDQSTLAVKNLLLSGIRPVALEFMDGGTLKAVENYAHLGLDPKAEAMLLVELDGPPEVLNRQSDQVVDILKKAGGSPVEKAANQAEADRLWKARRSISPAMFQIAPSKLNEDIAVPLGNLAEMVRRIKNTREKRELPIVCFGHAGDGNLHVNIMHDASDSDQRARALEAVSDVFADALHLGGTLSGEHGVGLNKLGYAGAEIDHVALDLMHGIKKLFDPAGILNPHKAIPYPEILS